MTPRAIGALQLHLVAIIGGIHRTTAHPTEDAIVMIVVALMGAQVCGIVLPLMYSTDYTPEPRNRSSNRSNNHGYYSRSRSQERRRDDYGRSGTKTFSLHTLYNTDFAEERRSREPERSSNNGSYGRTRSSERRRYDHAYNERSHNDRSPERNKSRDRRRDGHVNGRSSKQNISFPSAMLC